MLTLFTEIKSGNSTRKMKKKKIKHSIESLKNSSQKINLCNEQQTKSNEPKAERKELQVKSNRNKKKVTSNN